MAEVEISATEVRSEGRPTVTVTGAASVRVEPDEAFVFITLTATDALPGPALTDVATRGDALATLLDELEVPTADRSTTGITVNEEFDHTRDGRLFLGYCASSTVSVRLVDTSVIGVIVMRCTQELDARIAGPTWRVSPDNPAWLEAASQAAVNARDKAAAYAAGLDLKLGRLIEMAEPSDGAPRRMMRAAAAAREMPVETGEQNVTSAVQATFSLVSAARPSS